VALHGDQVGHLTHVRDSGSRQGRTDRIAIVEADDHLVAEGCEGFDRGHLEADLSIAPGGEGDIVGPARDEYRKDLVRKAYVFKPGPGGLLCSCSPRQDDEAGIVLGSGLPCRFDGVIAKMTALVGAGEAFAPAFATVPSVVQRAVNVERDEAPGQGGVQCCRALPH
jgi:hypothetical protein